MVYPSADKQFSKRLVAIYFIVFASFTVLVKQLWHLQIEQGAHFRELSKKNRIRSVYIPPPRGLIFDREGRILIDNRPRFDLVATIEDVLSPENEAKTLAAMLDVSRDTILKKITDRSSHLPYEPSIIVTDLDMETVIRVSENSIHLPGIDLRILPARAYVHGQLACHVLGYTGRINKKEYAVLKEKGYDSSDVIGKTGVEAAFENFLRGLPGGRQIQIDSLGHLDRVFGEKKPVQGNNVYLTLDLDLQRSLENAYGERNGAAVVLQVPTGEILAMLSKPGFDPNNFSTGDADRIRRYFIDPTHPLLNRAVSSQFAPGSTFKPIVALAALKEGFITEETSVFCNGTFKLGNTVFKCWRKWGHGETDLNKSIEQSCNVFYYNIGKEMGPVPIRDMCVQFGFGSPTGIPLKGEKKGLVPSPEWKKKRFRDPSRQRWHPGDTINYSIGQGYFLTTPVQLVRMVAAIAAKGALPELTLLKKVENDAGETVFAPSPPDPVHLKISPENLQKVRKAMNNVVHARYGTGKKSRVPGLQSAGKTGTAQVRTREGEKKNGWFICFAPFENPEIAMAILVENAESGGRDAAPIARRVLASYFDIPIEDDHPEEEAVTTDVEEEEITETVIENPDPAENARGGENREPGEDGTPPSAGGEAEET
jgi:penicillin-binding protein 2